MLIRTALVGCVFKFAFKRKFMRQKSEFTQLFLAEIHRRLFEENFVRLKKCLTELNETEIWYRPNAQSNSMGNLVLHLCGNLRQWVISTFDEVPDVRERQLEFEEKGPLPTMYLLDQIEAILLPLKRILRSISDEHLLKTYSVQGFEENGVAILLHAVEHFSYHVGQMTYYVKAKKAKDMGYYDGINLEAKKV